MRTRALRYLLKSMTKMVSLSEHDIDDIMLVFLPKTTNATAFTWISDVNMLSTIRQNDLYREFPLKEQILIGGLPFLDESHHGLRVKIEADPQKIIGQRRIECRQRNMDISSSLPSNSTMTRAGNESERTGGERNEREMNGDERRSNGYSKDNNNSRTSITNDHAITTTATGKGDRSNKFRNGTTDQSNRSALDENDDMDELCSDNDSDVFMN